MLRRLALIAVLAGGYAAAMYTSTGCSPVESPTEPQTLLSGRVVNAVSGAGVGQARVQVSQGSSVIAINSDADGGYSVSPPSGDNRVDVTATGFQPFTATVNVRARFTTTFDVRMQPLP